jgi:hypothetical protein
MLGQVAHVHECMPSRRPIAPGNIVAHGVEQTFEVPRGAQAARAIR